MPSRLAPVTRVYVDGAYAPYARALSVHQSSGAKTLDTATVEIDLRSLNARAVNLAIGNNTNKTIWITIHNGIQETPIHWGQVAISEVSLGREERVIYTSRIEPWHFGDPWPGTRERFGPNSVTDTYYDGVLNPTLDGVSRQNCAIPNGSVNYPAIFVDPDAVLTTNSMASKAGVQEWWSLFSAVSGFIWNCNAAQTYVRNPVPIELQAILPTSSNHLRHVRIPVGAHLPEILDRILNPLGYGWRVEYGYYNGAVVPIIQVFVRGAGVVVNVGQQYPGSTLDTALTNVIDARLQWNIGGTVNSLQCLGDFKTVEATWELVPAWSNAYDTRAADDVALESDSPSWLTTPALSRVWRDWVLNEAGDYSATRPTAKAYRDLSPEFGDFVVVTRYRFQPTLTQDNDLAPIGQTNGTTVEWSIDGGTTWNGTDDLEHNTVHVLNKECGIRFDGQFPPLPMVNAGIANCKVRVTASIQANVRLQAFASALSSPQSQDVRAIIDVGERFHWRVIDASSIYRTAVTNGTLKSLEGDDLSEMQEYCNKLLEAWNMAEVSGKVTIEGIDFLEGLPGYQVGQVISGIVGRGISLNARDPAQAEPRYPQIIGVEYQLEQQRRVLTLQTYRDMPEAFA